MPEAAGGARLQALRRRWEEDRSGGAFLPLAEEYRRLGRVGDALAVLEAGLRAQPKHLAAQVALGRCRLEAGDAAGAATTLERVIEQDPTQLVANKLLVEAYLRTGRTWEAGERLQLYAVLNDRDPDIERLQERIDAQLAARAPATALVAPPPLPRPTAPDAAPFRLDLPTPPTPARTPLAAPAPLTAMTPGAPLVASAAPAAEPAAGEVFHLAAWTVAAPDLARVPPPRRGDGGASEPFPGVAAGDRGRYLRALAAGGIFGLRLRQPAPAPAAVAVAPVAPASIAAEPEPEPDVQAAVESLAPSAAEPVGAPAGVPRATVTLGELYLRQGYATEAEEIFRAVLRREPENPAARFGLEAARRGQPAAAEPGLTARKRQLLTGYLARLRAGVRRVP
jgi:tetratricopeptide (TPR) repeat protein